MAFQWTPSHLEERDVEEGRVDRWLWAGNRRADEAATAGRTAMEKGGQRFEIVKELLGWLEKYTKLVGRIRDMMVDIFMEQQRLGRTADKVEAIAGGPRRNDDESPATAAFQLRRSRNLECGVEEATTIEDEIVRWFLQREWRLAWSGTPWLAIWASIWPRLEEGQRAMALRSLGATDVLP